jgi:hypothetical protein
MELDLRNRQYHIETLIQYVDEINMKTCINTQKLTAEFCALYALNEKYMSCVEDTYIITLDYVLSRQPHLTVESIIREIEKLGCYDHGI